MECVTPVHRRLPWKILPGLATDLVRRRRRSFLADCQAMLRHCETRWENLDAIPTTGPICLIANHYQRSDLWIGWAGALLTVGVAERRPGQVPHWLVLGDLHVRIGGFDLPFPGAQWAFRSVADIWDLVPTPGSDERGERAEALRRLWRLAIAGEVIGLFPEGPMGVAGAIGEPRPGVGRFLALLNRKGVAIVPAGIREVRGVLVARFGEPFALTRVSTGTGRVVSTSSDGDLGREIMQRIAALASVEET